MKTLDDAIAAHPDEAQLHYASGLLRVRLGMPTKAYVALQAAVKCAPLDARYAFTLAVAKIERNDAAGARQLLMNHRGYKPAQDLLERLNAEGIWRMPTSAPFAFSRLSGAC
ncbi:hypothetical protein ACK2SD_12340 [Pseudomonas sp. SC11]|uniref:hypothetical protein n=1 Tax=Pseudomonas sp. SC11 TaxID=326927 RepID=UPI00399B90F0